MKIPAIHISLPWQKLVASIILFFAMLHLASILFYNCYSSDAHMLQDDFKELIANSTLVADGDIDVDAYYAQIERTPLAFQMSNVATFTTIRWIENLVAQMSKLKETGQDESMGNLNFAMQALAETYEQHAAKTNNPKLKQFYLDLSMIVGYDDGINSTAWDAMSYIANSEKYIFTRKIIIISIIIMACIMILTHHFAVKPYDKDKVAQFIEKFSKLRRPADSDWLM